MKTIPADLEKALNVLGISNPSGWKRGPDIEAPPSYRISHVCQCNFFQVFLTPLTLNDREIMIGQCPLCKVVHWGDWTSKEDRTIPPGGRRPHRGRLPYRTP